MAFINTGKNRGFFNKNKCHYSSLLSDFFGSSCAPGARELNHDNTSTAGSQESLCSLCRKEISIDIPPAVRGKIIETIS